MKHSGVEPVVTGARVLITSRVVEQRPVALARLVERGCRLIENPDGSRVGRSTLGRLLESADALLVGTQSIDAAMLAQTPALRVIVKAGTGVDNIDLDAAAMRGIRVAATAGANAEAVADYTFGLLLAAARRITDADRSVREGRWERFTGADVHQKTLGIVGLGNVGRAVARRAAGFEMRILAVDVQYDDAFLQEYRVDPVDLDRLLSESDFVSLHIPFMPLGGHLLNRERITRMKHGSILVNTARGGLVDEAALYEALCDGRLAAAALDVFEQEHPRDTPLRTLLNVVLSPHNASYTAESMNHVADTAVEMLLALLEDTQEDKAG
jgi:phosphoglycerate dehydrogenase-like enzyme